MGYLVECLELFIRKVAYTKYDATVLVCWSNYRNFSIFLIINVTRGNKVCGKWEYMEFLKQVPTQQHSTCNDSDKFLSQEEYFITELPHNIVPCQGTIIKIIRSIKYYGCSNETRSQHS
jgi:hypothetical protein